MSGRNKEGVPVILSEELYQLLLRDGYDDHMASMPPQKSDQEIASAAWQETLAPLEKNLYLLLSQPANQLVTKATIFQELWPTETQSDILSQRLGDVVNRLRKKLDDDFYQLRTMKNDGLILLVFSRESTLQTRQFFRDLTSQEFKLFNLLWLASPPLVSREQCYQELWSDIETTDACSYVKLSAMIGQLRDKLSKHRTQCRIKAVPNQGYRLVY